MNDGYTIPLTFDFTCDNLSGEPMHIHQRAYIDVVNAVEIGGMLTENTTLYPNVHYRVTKNLAVPKGVTLTIKPGAVLKFEDGTGLSVSTVFKGGYLDEENSGKLIMQGTPDSLIVFDGDEKQIKLLLGESLFSIEESIPIEYVLFKNVIVENENFFGGYYL